MIVVDLMTIVDIALTLIAVGFFGYIVYKSRKNG